MEKKKVDSGKLKNLAIKVIISAVLLTYLFSKTHWSTFEEKLASFNYWYAPLVILFISLNFIISSYRWKKLLIFKNSEKASFPYLTTLYFTGSFFNNFMPTSVGGDVYKVIKLGKKIGSMTNAFSATFMERFLGVLALLLISGAGIIKMLGWKSLLLVFVCSVGAYIGIKVVFYLSKKSAKIKNIIDSLLEYKGQTKVVGFAFFNSFWVQICSIMSQYVLFLALGIHPPFFYAMFAIPVIILAGFFIPSLNNIGVQDGLYVSLFGLVGISAESALSVSLLYHLFRLLVSLFGGLLYALGLDD